MTEQERLLKKINERFIKAFVAFRLLEDDDHILVGLSGGKDSLMLTELLARRSRIQHPRFQVEATHVRMEDIQYATDTTYLQQFCSNLSVPLHIVTTSFSSPTIPPADLSSPKAVSSVAIPSQPQKPKPPCFLCSWNRRKQLFNIAQELGCNKIALGHHQDDLLHTALMNLLYQGRFATMPARLRMKKMPLQIIRPLCLVPESWIAQYAEMSHYQRQIKVCPYEHDTNRTTARKLYEEAERMNPEVRFSLWNALERDSKLIEEE